MKYLELTKENHNNFFEDFLRYKDQYIIDFEERISEYGLCADYSAESLIEVWGKLSSSIEIRKECFVGSSPMWYVVLSGSDRTTYTDESIKLLGELACYFGEVFIRNDPKLNWTQEGKLNFSSSVFGSGHPSINIIKFDSGYGVRIFGVLFAAFATALNRHPRIKYTTTFLYDKYQASMENFRLSNKAIESESSKGNTNIAITDISSDIFSHQMWVDEMLEEKIGEENFEKIENLFCSIDGIDIAEQHDREQFYIKSALPKKELEEKIEKLLNQLKV